MNDEKIDDPKMDDIELYLFFKELSIPDFYINYNKDKHQYDIYDGENLSKEPVLREDLEKFALLIEEWRLKYFPKQEPYKRNSL